jgi:4-amino-4-deoxy-L-arabinose transferase-like glycosyltransferase
MFALEPVTSLLLLFWIFYQRNRWLRHSVLSAAVVWAVLLVAITELLSLFHCLTFFWLAGAWGVVTLTLAAVGFWFTEKAVTPAHFKPRDTLLMPKILLLATSLIVATLAFVAWVAPPNTYDSMSYHMSRVVHWIQNRSVNHYPTNILRQLYLSPGSEFIITHLQILSGGDRLANFVQWFSMVGSICGVSLIAKQLGAGPRGQILAAVVLITLPMGILQASSTQNDYVVSFWLICFVYFLLLLTTKELGQPIWCWSLGVGGSLGLAMLTKGTAYIFAFPFLVWFGLSGSRRSCRRLWKPALIVTTVALAINVGYYARNFALFGSPIGPREEGTPGVGLKLTNDILTVSTLVSNSAKNLALEIGTPFEPLNRFTELAVYKLHSLIGLSVNDPRTTWAGTDFRIQPLAWHDEDSAGDPLHLAFTLAALLALICSRSLRKSPHLVAYSTAVTAGFLLFSFSLRWQPWHCRLLLPLFVLSSPFVALVLSRNERMSYCIAVGLLLAALPCVLNNRSRPLTGTGNIFRTDRIDLYFRNRPNLKDPYIGATSFVRSQNCLDVGLLLGDWEYPLWVLLREETPVHIRHVAVGNKSAAEVKSGFPNLSHCAIISVDYGYNRRATRELKSFKPVWVAGPVMVLLSSSVATSDR